MGTDEIKMPEGYAEMLKAAQEQAIKAAQAQAQAMLGNMPGVQFADMEEIQKQMQAGMPDMAQIQAIQAQMQGTIQEMMSNPESFCSWEIEKANDGKLDDKQLYLLAFGAPLFVYNSENVDSYDSQYDVETTKQQMEEWWGIQDHDSAIDTIQWLFDEGHHAKADAVLRLILDNADSIPADLADKYDDVRTILNYMLENQYCTTEDIPGSAMAWDLVRVVNVARWTHHCGYIDTAEMWQIINLAAEASVQNFASWEEYGKSFAFGRGVWQGDEDDCEAAMEIVDTLLKNEESPWKKFAWNEKA